MIQPQRDIAFDGGLRLADIGVLGSFAAMGVTGVGLWMLRDLDVIGGDAKILRALAHGLAIAALAFSLPSVAKRSRTAPPWGIEGPQVAPMSGLLLAALFGLAMLGIAVQLLSWSAPAVIDLIAAITFVLMASEWWQRATPMERVAVPLLSAALGAWMGACFWGYGMQNPAFLTKAAVSQYVTSYNAAIDTFFHASIINSVRNYGTASVGLDGLVPIPYHIFTHVFFAGLSALGGVSAIDFLNATSPVILLPLLPVSLVVFAASAARAWSTPRATDRPLHARPTPLHPFVANAESLRRTAARAEAIRERVAIPGLLVLLGSAFALVCVWVALTAFISERTEKLDAASISSEEGFSYIATVPLRFRWPLELHDDGPGRESSRLALAEDMVPLGPAHAPHADIRTEGAGRFSHWTGAILFSSSDNSDPRTNGRLYTLRVRPNVSVDLLRAGAVLATVAVVLFGPTLLSALRRIAARASPTPRATNRPMLTQWLTWMVVFAALAGIVPQPVAGNFFLNWNLVIHSETYGLSVSLALLWAAFLVTCLSERFLREGAATPRDYIALALAVLGFCLVSGTKLSTGLVLLASSSWLFLRLRLYRSLAATTALALAFICTAFTVSIGAPSGNRDAMQVVPFAFLKQFIGLDRLVPFMSLYYIWPLLYLVFRGIYQRSAGRGVGVTRGWLCGRALDLEFLGVLVVAGMLPGLVFDLPPKGPQSATVNLYFMDVQMWFAVGLLLALAMKRRPDVAAFSIGAGRLTPVILAALSVATFGVGTLPNLLKEFRNLSKQDAELRNLIREHPDWPSLPEARTLAGLVALGDTVLGLQRGLAAVYVPQSNTAYWQLRVHGCEVVPFLALGTAGVAMIDGLPPATCKSPNLGYYGYQQYALRDGGAAAAAPISNARLCERAAKSGLREVLILDTFPVAEPRRVNCRQ